MSRYRRSATAAAIAAERAQAKQLRAIERELREQRKAQLQSAHAAASELAHARTVELDDRMEELTSLVAASSTVDYCIAWDKLKIRPHVPPPDPGQLTKPTPEPIEENYLPPPPSWLERTIPALKDRYERRRSEGEALLADARAEHARLEKVRLANLDEFRAAHERRVAVAREEAAEKNRALDELRSAYNRAEPEAVSAVLEIVLAKDELPDIDSSCVAAFEGASRRAVVERQLPAITIIPDVESVRYVKSSNEFVEKRRSSTAIRTSYNSLCAGVVVRTMRAIAMGDEARIVETIVVNAYVDTTDPATGRRVRPTLISASASADSIRSLETSVLEPVACLKRLKARVSPGAHELVPVTPIVDFNMVDARFVTETNVLGSLDTRPNLANLTPTEFESLMTNLFEKMGLETRQTRASRDGGVDCVAWDVRPVVGGKVVIQAKRYKNTVGVSAVRDLYGTMMNEHAAKGILVTTSGYGRAAYEFAKEKPLELVSGENLLALLDQYANIKAKIEFPDDWVDLSPEPQ